MLKKFSKVVVSSVLAFGLIFTPPPIFMPQPTAHAALAVQDNRATADYWTGKNSAGNTVFVAAKDLEMINLQIRQKSGNTIVDLANYPEKVYTQWLKGKISAAMTIGKFNGAEVPKLFKGGVALTEFSYTQAQKNCGLDVVPAVSTVRYALTIDRTTEAEIAYIAMHLGAALSDSEKFLHAVHRVVVACPTGMGTSRLLASRLRATFQNIKIVDEVPILELNSEYIAAKDFDFIISTVPIARADRPVIVVSAALIDSDIKKIDAEISRQNKNFLGSAEEIEPRPPFLEGLSKITAYGQAIIALMKNYFFVREQITNINDACALAGKIAGKNAKNRAEIAESLLLREDQGSTLIVGRHMILLHCKSAAVKAPAFGILQLGEGFTYPEGGEVVRTAIVLLAPLNSDEFTLETIGNIASVLLDRWGFIEILHEGDNLEIRREVLKIFEDFYKNKLKELM